MRTPEFIARCMAAGMPLDLALMAAKAFEAECELAVAEVLEARRAKERARQAKHREKVNACHVMSRDQTLPAVLERDLTSERPQVVTPSLPSLRSEELKTPISPDGEMPPQNRKAAFAKPNGFARFWENYPKKVAKGAAEKAYAKALRLAAGPDPPTTILAGVERAKTSRDWLEGYIPHPATWLNDRRWEDEPAEIIPITGPRHERHHQHQGNTPREDRLGRMLAGAVAAVDERTA